MSAVASLRPLPFPQMDLLFGSINILLYARGIFQRIADTYVAWFLCGSYAVRVVVSQEQMVGLTGLEPATS